MWQEYDWCHLKNIINNCLNYKCPMIGGMWICKVYVVKFVLSLTISMLHCSDIEEYWAVMTQPQDIDYREGIDTDSENTHICMAPSGDFCFNGHMVPSSDMGQH